MAARKKPPDERTGRGVAQGQDPQFIAVSKAASQRQGIPIPKPSPNWHPSAQSWFRSLAMSGQSELYEASDWATAVAAAQAYNAFLKNGQASILAQFVRLSERLGVTVIDRKRSRIELVDTTIHDQDEDAADEAVTGWHLRLQKGEAS